MTERPSIYLGYGFAFAFFSPALDQRQKSSTYAFSNLDWSELVGDYVETSRTVNILWQGISQEAVADYVDYEYPDAGFRGIITSNSWLVSGGEWDKYILPVIGPAISFVNYENGPIKRVEPVRLWQEAAGFSVIDGDLKASRPPHRYARRAGSRSRAITIGGSIQDGP